MVGGNNFSLVVGDRKDDRIRAFPGDDDAVIARAFQFRAKVSAAGRFAPDAGLRGFGSHRKAGAAREAAAHHRAVNQHQRIFR